MISNKELEEWREENFKRVEREGITKETELRWVRGLSMRPLNALRNRGVNTIADALALSPDQLLEQKNFGESSLVELEDLLGPFGWPVREPQDPKDKRIVMTQGEFEHAITAAIEQERKACHDIAYDEAMKWGADLNGRTAGLHIAGEIRDRAKP